MQLNTDIRQWPLDLLVDYVLKIYHRGAIDQMPQIEELLDDMAQTHADTHPELTEIKELFSSSVYDLKIHFEKEENVLYPYITDMYNAVAGGGTPEPIHCGSISHPIGVMMNDHEGEAERYRRIALLTDDYKTTAGNCDKYNRLMDQLKSFHQALLEHIFLENEIIFPKAVAYERQYIRS